MIQSEWPDERLAQLTFHRPQPRELVQAPLEVLLHSQMDQLTRV